MVNHDNKKLPEQLTALCDECDYITDIAFKMRPHPNTVEETYFNCEHCNHHYLCFVTDYKVRAKQRRKEKMLGDKHIDDRLKLQEEINESMEELKLNQNQKAETAKED